MKLKLLILSVASFSCLFTPTWGMGLLKAKAALLGAGALAAKGALFKGLVDKKHSANKPVIIIQKKPPPQSQPYHKSILEIKPFVEVNKPLLEGDTNPPLSILRWNPDIAIPALRLPVLRPPVLEVDSPVTVEKTSMVELKPCPKPVSLSSKYHKILDKASRLWNFIAEDMHFKKNALTGFFESIEPRETPVLYQIVRSPNSYPVPVEEDIFIGK
ncbi:hypothetical protein K1T71_010371 [Dendrolimus kikuchii]|uniref:Uncharacterized protein n=1 Tax=Dendrolimus kikuchii TaxID=765133 RepID=A0ACC1CRI6_9NEOP|nr:hypothetical protein K1T71_010371 [Dendrolimus kikuchii]